MFKSSNKQCKQQRKMMQKNREQVYKRVDRYYDRIKSNRFEMIINSGVNEYDIGEQGIYNNMVLIQSNDQLLDSIISGYSSIYKIDYKSFEYRSKLQLLVNTIRQLLRIIQKIKLYIKQHNNNRYQIDRLVDENNRINFEYKQLKTKYDQLIQFKQKHKYQEQQLNITLIRLNKLQQQQKVFISSQQELFIIKQLNTSLLNQNNTLKLHINQIHHQSYTLSQSLHQIINSSFNIHTINHILNSNQNNYSAQHIFLNQSSTNQSSNQLSNNQSSTNQSNKLLNYQPNQLTTKQQNKLATKQSNKLPINQSQQIIQQQFLFGSKQLSIFEMKILLNSKLSSKLISYLSPNQIKYIFSLSKLSRFFLTHTPQVIYSTFKSIIGYKNYQISFFHRHINNFQSLLKQIPQQIIQSTFYQYNILKQNIGGDFYTVLNLCANIFEGKFTGETIKLITKSVGQYIQSKQIIHYMKQQQSRQQRYLRVDKQLIEQFYNERKYKKQQIMKQIQQMTKKILLTQSLYSVDNNTLHQFYSIIIKHFTILFVLSKNLFNQAKNIQYLNHFLLAQLNQINKVQIQKQYDLEDINTQLQASNKMNTFLSDKCNQIQHKILRQNKQHLDMQKHITKLNSIIKLEQQTNQSLQQSLIHKQNQISTIKLKYNQLKSIYNNSKDKYNRLINQLGIVKQTILKIK